MRTGCGCWKAIYFFQIRPELVFVLASCSVDEEEDQRRTLSVCIFQHVDEARRKLTILVASKQPVNQDLFKLLGSCALINLACRKQNRSLIVQPSLLCGNFEGHSREIKCLLFCESFVCVVRDVCLRLHTIVWLARSLTCLCATNAIFHTALDRVWQ